MRRLFVLTIALAAIALTVEPPRPPLHPQDFRPLLLRPAFARTLSKSWLPMLVDLLWLRSLNAISLRDTVEKNTALYEYGVVVTELDPRFRHVYEYLGLNIPFAVARNTFVGGDLAADLFRRGLRVYPRDLNLHMYLGFTLMHHERKFAEASDVFAEAAKLPDALPWFGLLATRLKAHAGSAQDGLNLTRELLNGELDESVRAELEKRVGELEVEVMLQEVDRAIAVFTESAGRPPTTITELVESGFYQGSLVDPKGGFISIGDDGRANSTTFTRRLDIYE